jgi:hypothetical protein
MSEGTMIHVRFAPDGSVTEIGARPETLSPQEWFNWLSRNAADCYKALAGGRGYFRLPPGDLDRHRDLAAAS